MEPKVMKSYHTDSFELVYSTHDCCWVLSYYDPYGEVIPILIQEDSLEDLGKIGGLISNAN